jgi:mono/diheme cytochrome c family protein
MTFRHTAAALALWLLCLAGVIHLAAQSTTPGGGSSTPTFARDIAPIFYKNCTNCHRPGELAPMSLLTYKDARPWARSIAERVSAGSMPPWHADPQFGSFLNDRHLSDADRAAIASWVAAGAPEGNPADLPQAPTYESGWTIGEPDAIFAMQEDYPVPASGEIAYQYLEVPTNLTEDKWIQAFEVKPGDPKAVHHVIVYARSPAQPGSSKARAHGASKKRPAPLFEFAPDMDIPAGQTGGPPLPPEQRKPVGPNDRPEPKLGPSIGGFAPGQFIRVYQEGTGMKIAAGTTLVFQMHYTSYGKATTDRTRIGVKYAKTPPQTQLHWAALANGAFRIPAGAADHRVDAEMTITQDITLWSILPHTHVRGKRWVYELIYPDGRKETVLSVPKYDFNWQTDYVFSQPQKWPKGTKLHATAWYDNSAANKSNPDPTKDVSWGDQTWEEMMFTGLTFSVDAARPSTSAGQ